MYSNSNSFYYDRPNALRTEAFEVAIDKIEKHIDSIIDEFSKSGEWDEVLEKKLKDRYFEYEDKKNT